MTKEFSTILEDYDGAGGGGDPGGFKLDIKRLLTLRGPIMAGVALVLAVPAMLAGWFLTPEVYTATGQLRFYSSTFSILGDGRDVDRSSYSKWVGTELQTLTGPKILQQVLDSFADEHGVSKLDSFKNSQDPLSDLTRAVSARTRGDSELVSVSCTLPIREEAVQIVDAMQRIYKESAIREMAATPGTRMGILIDLQDDLEKTLEQQRNSILQQEGDLGALEKDLPPETSPKVEQYNESILDAEKDAAQLESTVSSLDEQIEELKALQEQIGTEPGLNIVEFGISDRLNLDPRVSSMRTEVFNAKMELEQAEKTQQDTSPLLKKARERYNTLSQSAEREERRVRSEIIETVLAEIISSRKRTEKQRLDKLDLKAKFEEDLKAEEEKQDKLTLEYNKQQAEIARRRSELSALKLKASETQSQLSRVRDEITTITNNNRAPSRIDIASDAIAPNTQDYKKKIRYMLMGLIFSMGVGVALGVLLEISDQQVRSPKDFARLTPIPVLASIPHALEDPALREGEHARLMSEHPNSRSADEFRRVLSRILYPEEAGAAVNSLLVVSPSRGDGKTSLACNLALSLGQANRRVLLVDINCQRASVERMCGLKPGPGLTELLDGLYDREELLREVVPGKLYVLGPGSHAGELSSRLASREMVEFIEWADENFDHTIIDTAPLLLVSDAKLMAPTVDGVITVVGVGVSTLGMIRRCLSDLEHLHANVIGVVLNKTRRLRGGYMRKNLELYYDYASNPENGGKDQELPEMVILDDGVEPPRDPSHLALLPLEDDAEELDHTKG